MPKVLLDMSMSLDGYIAGPDDDDAGLHNWYFAPSDNSDDPNKLIVDDLIQSTGAIIMGRRSYEMGIQFDGFIDNPYQVPHIILTHTPPEELPKGETEFIFITDGIENAINTAIERANGKTVVIGGGADITQKALKAGLIDEITIHLVPHLIGQGIRLFDHIEADFEIADVVQTSNVTHITYRVLKTGRN